MKHCKRLLALVLCAALAVGLLPQTASAESSGWTRGLNGALGWNEDTYYSIAKRTSNNNWRQALASANGEIAFMESGDPDEDVFIFNNTKIVYDATGLHEAPDIAGVLDEQRSGAINYDRWVWNDAANAWDQQTYGISGGRGMVWSRPYQPAAQYRIKNNDYTAANRTNYNRWTNYETAEVGAQWRDASGNEWNRRSFASRADDVIVTYIEAPAGKTLDLTLTMDHLTDMRNEGTVDALPDSDYVITQEGGKAVGFGTVAKYQIRNDMGSRNPNKTLFSYGGWASATRIVTTGSVEYTAAKRTVAANSGFSVSQAFEANDPRLHITDTSSVLLITKVDRQDDGCTTVGDVKQTLYDRLQGEIAALVTEKAIQSSEESYQKLLAPHAELHGGMFNNVRLDLCRTPEELADRELTNQRLIQKQDQNDGTINKAFLERVYNNGRYGLICAHGYGSTRLGGIWCGTWNPSWSGDYTLDANTNLQVSGLNTGNMAEAGEGYVNFIVRMVADWEINAERIYGMEDAILGPPRVDGTGQGQSYHYSDTYPHVFVNGITDWLLLPMFEYWQCYGDRQIPVGRDIDLERNMHVLDWTEEDVARIRADGYYDLEQDVLFPLAMKAMNFWTQFADENYYTDGAGVRHVKDGTTLSSAVAAGDCNARYIFAPGFSPENSPARGGASVQALAYNVTMDIAAAHDALLIARTLLRRVDPDDPRLAEWTEFEQRIPDYLYEPGSGELKEWASYALAEAHNHRHESHAYAAWPGYEAQENEQLREGLAIAMDLRSAAYNGQEATEPHGATHKALVEARLKRPLALERVMLYLLTNGYQYSNMLTSHNRDGSSCLCTDSAFGLMGAVNESLLYSNTGVIEILPTLLPELDAGSVTGLRARNNTQVDITWDKASHTASAVLTTDEESLTLQILCGVSWKELRIGGAAQPVFKDELGRKVSEVTLKKGVPVTLEFLLESEHEGATRDPYGVLPANSCDEIKGDLAPDSPDGSVGETGELDYVLFKNMDFGENGCRPRVTLTAENHRTMGGRNRDGSSLIRIYDTDPGSGAAPLCEARLQNTGGLYRTLTLELPDRLRGVQDIYIRFQDGGCTLRTVEFEEMTPANVEDGARYSVSAAKPLKLELDFDSYRFTLNGAGIRDSVRITTADDWTLIASANGEEAFRINFSTWLTEANRLLPKGLAVQPGAEVPLAGEAESGVTLWLAPPAATEFQAGETMTTGSPLAAPTAEGIYALAVVKNGAVLSRSDALVRVSASGLADVDFADPTDNDKYEIVGKTSAQQTAQGLVVKTTRNSVEPANGQNSGTQASTPEDLIRVPVTGDWTATLRFAFDPSANNGYYQFFGFYAAQGSDYQNMAGIRGGDGALQDFLRKNGSVTAETQNSTPGLAAAGTYRFRLEKQGDSYICYRSADGAAFDEIFRYEGTGIAADAIVIDAYTGMTEGYTFTLETLSFELGAASGADGGALQNAINAAQGIDGSRYTAETWKAVEAALAGAIAAQGGAQEAMDAAALNLETAIRALEKQPEFFFDDVMDPAKFYYAPVYWAVNHKPQVTNGATETTFNPDGACTRGHVVTFLWRAAGEPEPTSGNNPFTDLKQSAFYYKAVLWAVEKGITTGATKTTFAPGKPCTRGQIVTFLWRFKNSPEPTTTENPFGDVKESGFYYKAVLWAVENNVTSGTGKGKFSPDSTCTRGQVVTFLYRASGE